MKINKIQKPGISYSLIQIITLLIITTFPFLGSDCDKVIEAIGGGSEDIIGRWRLVYNSGSLHDVCPGEIVEFQNNGIAVLHCPNEAPINRNYTVSNNVLTYTQTNIQYQIAGLSSTTLQLNGINVQRDLTYSRITTDVINDRNINSAGKINSSEIKE